ncbi:hypothetical protein EYF80_002728 [Liparis tanakae]|uniref:Uncharacterized protein n=1 Tax=Liparis tanakae TaxID=230148 RepID=A0A4Z2JB31_9TELE|nr:hypothetical protein EYF80_002728 [Liparis tanakae]
MSSPPSASLGGRTEERFRAGSGRRRARDAASVRLAGEAAENAVFRQVPGGSSSPPTVTPFLCPRRNGMLRLCPTLIHWTISPIIAHPPPAEECSHL